MKVSFQLTMPNVGSWNGKWTGASKEYFVIRTFTKKEVDNNKTLSNFRDGGHSWTFPYDFGDGWTARVIAQIVDAPEANNRLKRSAGFCGYEWMIDSILKHGKIIVEDKITETV